MKKLFILLFAATITLNSKAQIKNTFLLSVRGNYIQKSSNNGTSTSKDITFGKYLDAGISGEGFITDKFVIGLGVDYYWSKEVRSSNLFIDRYLHIEKMKIKASGLVPNIYAGYYFKILNNFYFNLNLGVGLGQLKTQSKTKIAESTIDYSSGDIEEHDANALDSNNDEEISKDDYFRTGLYPSFNYFITNTLGFSLTIGKVEYSFLDWKTDNSTWTASFNPTYWSFGIRLKFDPLVD